MNEALAEALMDWRGSCPYNQDIDFLFGSSDMKGTQPYSPDTMRAKILKPAALRAGISKTVGWHSGVRLQRCCNPLGHPSKRLKTCCDTRNAKTTMNIYAQSIPAGRREAQQKVAQLFALKSGNEKNVPRKLVTA
jgi:hypothetical protein